MRIDGAAYYYNECDEEKIAEAEKQLGFTFPEIYKSFILRLGAMEFNNHKWFGICDNKKLNTLHITLEERANTSDFPADCLVLEYTGNLHDMILLSSDDKVLAFRYGRKPMLVCDSLNEYLGLCQSDEWKEQIRKIFRQTKFY
jgi:hypothetical protein